MNPDTGRPGSAHEFRAEADSPASLLDALDAAAVGLLEPMLGAVLLEGTGEGAGEGTGGHQGDVAPPSHDPGGAWRAGLAEALDRLARAALALELIGLGHVATLLRGHLLEPCAPDAAAFEVAVAEAWISDAIAFCGGQLPAAEAAVLVERLRDWPAVAARISPELIEPIAARLRQDAERIAAATLAEMQARRGDDGLSVEAPPAPVSIGEDELAMLAEAAGQLAEEFEEALGAADDTRARAPTAASGGQGGAGAVAASPPAEGLELAADAIERYANAVSYVGLETLGKALATLHANLLGLAHRPEAFGVRQRALLQRLPDAWARLFREFPRSGTPEAAVGGTPEAGSTGAAADALALLGDEAWPAPASPELLESARRSLGAVTTVSTRRVSVSEETVGEQDLSLEIPLDADRVVVENLLRELPMLSHQFSECIERIEGGSAAAIGPAQRIAHTLKGSANTVGVRGIALLTHQLEDLLQLLDPLQGALAAPLRATLSDAADCLAEMSEAVAGLGPAPVGAAAILGRVREWTQRVLDEPAAALAGGMESPHGPAADVPAAAPATGFAPSSLPAPSLPPSPSPSVSVSVSVSASSASSASTSTSTSASASASASASSEPVAAGDAAAIPEAASEGSAAEGSPAAPAEAQEWLRVPASLIERLLAFANEASILLSQAQEQAIEVDRGRAGLRGATDQLQDLAGELERLVDVRGLALSERRAREDFDMLELDEYNDLHMVSRRIAESGADGRLIEQQLGQSVAALRDSLSQLERIQVDLREAALRTRTVRVDTVVPRWRRTVRQAARMAGREATLQVDGESIEVDSQLLQSLVEPLAHLLRNAIDHGVEPPAQRERLGKPAAGRLVLGFARDGPDLLIECRDDGAGFDLPAVRARAIALGLLDANEPCDDETLLQWVLLPGFSTRDQATQLSGRGIGLDVVSQAVRELRGTLEIETLPGRGTRFRLRLPVRLAALPVIVVRSSTHVLALSVREVEQVLAAETMIEEGDGGRHVQVAAGRVPVVRLEDALGLPEDAFAPPPGVEPGAAALLQVRLPGGERVAVLVPEPGQTRSVVLRPLASFLPPLPGIEGAAVLGDGAVAPVIDLPQLLAARRGARAAPALSPSLRQAPVCLVVDDSVSVRRTMEQFVRDLGYDTDSAADGVEALEHVQRRVPALVLADLEMPRMNGVELVRALRARPETRAVPVIMITSRSSDKHRKLALEAGVDVFLTKPYTEDALAGHIARLRLSGRSGMG